MVQSDWSQEPSNLNANDPLTLSAYRSSESKIIEDIETAPPGMLDINLERSVFRHRALVHAPIYIERFNNALRQRVSRLVRKTLSFSKKLENHVGTIWYFIHHYNKLVRAKVLSC